MQVGQVSGTSERVEQAIRTGSSASGVSFDYLARTAYRESSYRTDLKSDQSSATGLFQFLDQTWLGLVKEEGPSVGLVNAASAITKDSSGRYDVADPATKNRILDLRKDPTVSAVIAGKFTQRNRDQMTASLGRAPTEGELYAGHVLGSAGGAKLVQLAAAAPGQPAAVAFPEAASRNRAIFYNGSGTAKTVGEVYKFLTREDQVPAVQSVLPSSAQQQVQAEAQMAQLANVIQAQTHQNYAPEKTVFTPGESVDQTRRTLQTTIAAMSVPGDTSGKQVESGGRMEGWRAKRASDAFSQLMRSDAAELEANPPMDLLSMGGNVAAAQAVSQALPGLGGMSGASAFASLSSRMPAANAADALATGREMPSATAESGPRHSRVLTEFASRASRGAPAMALPMVTDTMGVTRPSRFSAAAQVAAIDASAAPSRQPAADAVPVRTQTIRVVTPPAVAPVAQPAAQPAAKASGDQPILPPVNPTAAELEAARMWLRPSLGASGEAGSTSGPIDLVAASRGRR
jgi:hypothetical protein